MAGDDCAVEAMSNGLKSGKYSKTDDLAIAALKVAQIRCIEVMDAVNSYIRSLGKKDIFPDLNTEDYKANDYEAYAKLYRYLMSKPGEEDQADL